jgi:hypothetical protein
MRMIRDLMINADGANVGSLALPWFCDAGGARVSP